MTTTTNATRRRRSRFGALVAVAVLASTAAACGDDDDSAPAVTGGATEATTAGTGGEATTAPTSGGTTGETGETTGATSGTAGEDTPTGSVPQTDLRVAVVLPSAANDLSFSQSMSDSLQRLVDAGAIAEFAVSENMFVVEDAAGAIRDYASQGFDLVIAHGSQYGGSLQEIAPEFPDVAFAWGTAADTFGLENVSGYTASSDEGAYVMGTMAAAMADGGSIGVIGPIEVGDAKLYVDGFIAGAKAQDPDIVTGSNYTESFSDTALAAEAATSFVDGGATVLTGSAQMTAGAIGVAADRDVLWFGTNSNQTQLAPDNVVASQVYRWDVILAELLAGIVEGDLGGETYDINLANGGEVIEFNDAVEVPADVMTLGEDTIAGIVDGSITTGADG